MADEVKSELRAALERLRGTGPVVIDGKDVRPVIDEAWDSIIAAGPEAMAEVLQCFERLKALAPAPRLN
jgi:hypothetical protein